MTSPQMKNETGHDDRRSVVGAQLKAAFPERLLLRGNRGEGRTIFPSSRIRLSQKISSALSPGKGVARGFAGFFSPGTGIVSSCAVPRFGLLRLAVATTVPICSDT